MTRRDIPDNFRNIGGNPAYAPRRTEPQRGSRRKKNADRAVPQGMEASKHGDGDPRVSESRRYVHEEMEVDGCGFLTLPFRLARPR